jgi:hypothetical protein
MQGKPVKMTDSTPSTDAHIQQPTDRRGLIRPETLMTGPEHVARNRPEDIGKIRARSIARLDPFQRKRADADGRGDCRKAVRHSI